MKILDLGPELFAFVRENADADETIVCAFNFTPAIRKVRFADLHAGLAKTGEHRDILNGRKIESGPRRSLKLKPYHATWIQV